MWGTVGHLMGARLLSGTYECSLDSRFRLAVPARLRDAFAGGAVLGLFKAIQNGGLKGCADKVRIVESRPLSRDKRWRLQAVTERAPIV